MNAVAVLELPDTGTARLAAPASHTGTALMLALSLHALVIVATPAFDRGSAAAPPHESRIGVQLHRATPQPLARTSDVPQQRPAPVPARPQLQTVTAPASEPVPATATTPAAPASTESSAAPTVSDAAPAFTEARVDTRYHHNPAPAYPPMSRRLGEAGEVVLCVRVGVDGAVLGVAIERSSGFPRLDEAARRAVLAWRFEPARRGDVAIESSARVPLKFVLES